MDWHALHDASGFMLQHPLGKKFRVDVLMCQFAAGHPDVAAMWASLPDEQHFALHPTAYLPVHVPAAALAPPALPFPLPASLTLPAIGASQR